MSYEKAIERAACGLPTPPSHEGARKLALDLAAASPERRLLLLANSPRVAAEPLLPSELARLAYEQRHREPQEMVALTEAAIAAIDSVRWPPSMPPVVRRDLEAEVLLHHANALRVCGRIAESGRRLRDARSLIQRGSGDPCLVALTSAFQGSLAYVHRRFLDAALHYRKAARYYRSVGQEHERGRELIAAGRAYLAEAHYEAAVSHLKAGLSRIDVGDDPSLALGAAQCLAKTVALDGRPAEALEIIECLGSLREDHAETLLELKVSWVEGCCLTDLERFDHAAELLRYVGDEFLARRCERDAALVQFDLITALAGMGAQSEIRDIVSRLPAILAAYEAPVEALAALRLLEAAIEKELVSVAMAKQAAGMAEPIRESRL